MLLQKEENYNFSIPGRPESQVSTKCPIRFKTAQSKIKLASIMIKVTLSNNFDNRLYKMITSISPNQWIEIQRQLFQKLMNNKKLHEKYFNIFYQNHIKLSNWYHLAGKQKNEIQPYLFRQFLRKSKEHYSSFDNEKLKQVFETQNSLKSPKSPKGKFPFAENVKRELETNNKSNNSSKLFEGSIHLQNRIQPWNSQSKYSNLSNMRDGNDQENTIPAHMKNHQQTSNVFNESQIASDMLKPSRPIKRKENQLKTTTNSGNTGRLLKSKQMNFSLDKSEVMETFFKNCLQQNQAQRKRKPLNLKLYSRTNRVTEEGDSHDLYMKTFDACQGRRYIYYDYQKHMKGLKEKGKYNQFLRGNGTTQGRQNRSMRNSSLNLTQYQEFQEHKNTLRKKQKCSLLPINMVLSQKSLNNYEGLKEITDKNKSNKVVFVNHQGKPITYYIRKKQKQNSQNLKSKIQHNQTPAQVELTIGKSITSRA